MPRLPKLRFQRRMAWRQRVYLPAPLSIGARRKQSFEAAVHSQSASVEWAGSGLDGTVCFPPLIKPDRRFSRIRLSEFLARRPRPTRQRGLGRSRTFMALIAQWAVTSPLRLLLTAEQVASLRSPTGFPNQRS